MNNPNATRYTAIGLVVLGLIFIFFAWNGASGTENGQDLRFQFPFLLSGGLGGIALVMAGLTLVRTFEARRDTMRLQDQLMKLTTAVERLEATMRADRGLPPAHSDAAPALGTPVTTGGGASFPPPATPPFESAPSQ